MTSQRIQPEFVRAPTREYIWLGDTPLAVIEGATLSYVHPDHLDRPVAMTTSSGPAVAWSAKYDPFGNVVSITNPTAMPLRFPGQVFQIEDGLSYNWHRNYDPTLGRYSQADPLGFVDGPGIYNYVNSSPAMKVDPRGLDNPSMGPYGPYWTSGVMICSRPAQILGGLADHNWILTPNKSVGMGADPRFRPGERYDLPFTPVQQDDHSKDQPTQCTTMNNVDPVCVDKKLRVGESLGRFVPLGNNCQSFAYGVVNSCRTGPQN
jgi:RHS repeat-associated protein